mmetsp:Transcript_99379/g.207019  ORF Transcript_99379/g.207019 Transcript_99379/m.207019 type:complete len:244 (+) Transcript_99379:66-797(+)
MSVIQKQNMKPGLFPARDYTRIVTVLSATAVETSDALGRQGRMVANNHTKIWHHEVKRSCSHLQAAHWNPCCGPHLPSHCIRAAGRGGSPSDSNSRTVAFRRRDTCCPQYSVNWSSPSATLEPSLFETPGGTTLLFGPPELPNIRISSLVRCAGPPGSPLPASPGGASEEAQAGRSCIRRSGGPRTMSNTSHASVVKRMLTRSSGRTRSSLTGMYIKTNSAKAASAEKFPRPTPLSFIKGRSL